MQFTLTSNLRCRLIQAKREVAERLGRFLALVFLVPVALHLVGRGLDGAWLVCGLAAMPALSAYVATDRSMGVRGRDETVWMAALLGAFATPLLPAIFQIDGFETSLALCSGALAWLAWHGRLTVLTASPRWGRVARLFFVVLAMWSTGSALRGFLAFRPEGAPWTMELLFGVATDPFGARSLIDSARPFGQLLLRLEMLAFMWSGFELALGALGRGEGKRFEARLLGCLVWAVGLGVFVSVTEFSVASIWRGDASIWARAEAGIGRNPRPLLDHNALGSVLVLIAPLLILGGAVWRSGSGLFARMAICVAALASVVLLVLSRSKSALAGFSMALLLGVLFVAVSSGGRARRWAYSMAGLGLLVLAAFNMAPESVIERVAANRYGNDLVRVVRFEAAASYLSDNRALVWKSTRAVGSEHPLVGVGLGRLPLLLGEHHDPDGEGWFNPRNENAHSQYLQWWAEEGWIGLTLGLLTFAAAILGGLRRRSFMSLAGSAAMLGLALNSLVGHGLLVSSVAMIFAAIAGWLIAGGAMTRLPDEAAQSSRQRRYAAPIVGASAFVLAFSPLILPGGRRPLPLSGATVDCYPWDWIPGTASKRARAMGPNAYWYEEWKSGSVMKIPVRDVRDARFEEPVRLELWVNGKRVIKDFVLPHHTRKELAESPELGLDVNQVAYLRIERPAGVADGELVELHLISSSFFVGSRVFSPDNRRISLRMWPAFFS